MVKTREIVAKVIEGELEHDKNYEDNATETTFGETLIRTSQQLLVRICYWPGKKKLATIKIIIVIIIIIIIIITLFKSQGYLANSSKSAPPTGETTNQLKSEQIKSNVSF